MKVITLLVLVPFESPRDFIKKFSPHCFPHLATSHILLLQSDLRHVEAWGQDLRYNVLLYNKKFHQLSSFDCVGFSVLSINFFKLAVTFLRPGKKILF